MSGKNPYDDLETEYSPSPYDYPVPVVPVSDPRQAPAPSAWDSAPAPAPSGANLAFTETTANQYVSGSITPGQASAVPKESGNTFLLGRSAVSSSQQPSAAPTTARPTEDASQYAFYNPRKYREYFNVDTNDVAWRVSSSLIGPFKPDFMEVTWNRPDLYGPFWVATTLIFVIAVAGNYAKYLAFNQHPASNSPPDSSGTQIQQQWFNDYSKMGISAAVIYGYIFILGVGLYFAVRYFKGDIKLVNIFCIYGYCLTIFIPVSFVCIVPLDWLRWLMVGISTAISGLFLVANFKTTIYEAAPAKAVMFLLGISGLHAGLGVALKLLFFSY
jgi:hypothetical protein